MDYFTLYQHGIVFGDKSLGLRAPPYSALQNTLLYDNACVTEDYPGAMIPHKYATFCPTFADGLMTRGLTATLITVENSIRGLAEAQVGAVFAHLIGGPTNPNYLPGSAAYDALMASFTELSGLVIDLVGPAMGYSGYLYSQSVENYIKDFDTFRIAFLVCFIVLILLFYIVIYHPIIQRLNVSARQTRALMLVLPPDVVKGLASVQKFITENAQ